MRQRTERQTLRRARESLEDVEGPLDGSYRIGSCGRFGARWGQGSARWLGYGTDLSLRTRGRETLGTLASSIAHPRFHCCVRAASKNQIGVITDASLVFWRNAQSLDDVVVELNAESWSAA